MLQAGRTRGAAASERRRLSAPTWRMEICDPGMQRCAPPRRLPAAARAAESCTLGRVVPGDGGPAAAGRLARSMLPPRRSPAALAAGQKPAPEGGKGWITPAARIQLASLGQRAPGGKPWRWRAAPAASSGPLTDAHGEEGQGEHGGNLLGAAYKAPPLLLRAARASLCLPAQEELLSSQYLVKRQHGTGRLPAALGTEQMQGLLDSHHYTGSTCCHGCQPFGQPVQDGAKTPGSNSTGYDGQAHLPGAPEGMRNPRETLLPQHPWLQLHPKQQQPTAQQTSLRPVSQPTNTHGANNSSSTLSPDHSEDRRFPREGQEKCYPALPPHRT